MTLPLVRAALLPLAAALLLPLSACASGSAAPTSNTPQAAPQRPNAGSQPSGPRPYTTVVPASATTDEGLFDVHKVGNDYLFEIPDSLLGKDMLLITRIAQVPSGLGGFLTAGVSRAEQVLRWERNGDRIMLRKYSFNQVADDSLPISESVVINNFAPILASFDIQAIGPDSASTVINVTSFYAGDTPALAGLTQSQRSQYQVRNLDQSRSYIDRVGSYPLNVDVRHTLTYNAGQPPSDAGTGTISMQMHQSMVLLPVNPMKPRLADDRVGYFSITQVNFGLDELKAAEQTFIRRWRLEPSDPAAYARGELVEPVKPIVYYLDPATPERWRPYVRQGVEDWNAAFEAAGFRNAIRAADPPSPAEDPDWNPEDVRYSVVRWAASLIRNAMGPSVSDPRTGEIIESDIVWYHNHLRSYRNRLMLETGAANPAARTLDMDDDFIGEAMRQVIAHEVGHALGLPHNMIGSSSYPTDSLRSVEFARRMGVSPSVMDYARQNYVAQPGDGLQPTDFIRRIGPYDHYSIEWGYRWLDTETHQEEKPTLDAWILEHADDPMYRFGSSTGWNPDAQTEDMGDDPVRASNYGIMNLQRVVPNLIDWTSAPGANYDELDEIYGELIGQWSRYVGHVVTLIGGRYENTKANGQDGPIYTPVSRERQEAAVQFMVDQVFDTPTWMLDADILGRIEHAGAIERVRARQESFLNNLLDPGRMQRVIEAHVLDPAQYSLAEYMDDIEAGIWSGLAQSDAYRRNLQRAHVERLEWLLTEEPPTPPAFFGGNVTRVDVSQSDIRPLARAQLTDIRADARTARGRTSDRVVRAHLDDIVARIDRILEGGSN
ncbi:MAG: zinc-dependent metalloprotease [Myxococcota bacterium]